MHCANLVVSMILIPVSLAYFQSSYQSKLNLDISTFEEEVKRALVVKNQLALFDHEYWVKYKELKEEAAKKHKEWFLQQAYIQANMERWSKNDFKLSNEEHKRYEDLTYSCANLLIPDSYAVENYKRSQDSYVTVTTLIWAIIGTFLATAIISFGAVWWQFCKRSQFGEKSPKSLQDGYKSRSPVNLSKKECQQSSVKFLTASEIIEIVKAGE